MCRVLGVLAFGHMDLEQLATRAADDRQWKATVFLKARKVLTGESLPDFLPQGTRRHSFLGYKVHQTFMLINTTAAKELTECDGHLPKDWFFEDFPDGRGNLEKQMPVTPTIQGQDGESAAAGCRMITFYEENGVFLKDMMHQRQVTANQGEEMYQRALTSQRKAPGDGKPRTLEDVRNQITRVKDQRKEREGGCHQGSPN